MAKRMSKNCHMCDTDVWVKLSCVDKVNLLFMDCDEILITEVVKIEVNHLAKNYPEYKCSLDKLVQHLRSDTEKVSVIYPNKVFDSTINASIRAAAASFGYTLGSKSIHKDFGEISTAIIADHMGINIIKSDDKKFADTIVPKNFLGINVINLSNIFEISKTKGYLTDKERIALQTRIEEISRHVDDIKSTVGFIDYMINPVEVFLNSLK